MTVAELIEHLKTFPQNAKVTYSRWSEQVLLEPQQIRLERYSVPRADGWVQNARPDMPTEEYVEFPGN